MNVLFLTLIDIYDIEHHGIYTDLLREFVKNGHNVYVVSASEKRNKGKTELINTKLCKILKVRIGNIQKTNIISKGISTILLGPQFIQAIKKYLSDIKFDLIIYSTPPITLAGAVEYVKRRDNAKTYLLLKDIFPQNAVDLGLLNKNGLLYIYFRHKEKKLYELSDYIGCMSKANLDYVIKHNSIDTSKIHVNPNSTVVEDLSFDENKKREIRKKYELPIDKTIFLYAGNLGKPQDVKYIVKCLNRETSNDKVHFLIIGNGTDKHYLDSYINTYKPKNVTYKDLLPKDEFDKFVGIADIGLIFLDYRFNIPNFPSRLLSYMQAKLPVVSVTDKNTDIGDIITNNHFGFKAYSNNVEEFHDIVIKCLKNDNKVFGNNAYRYLCDNYDVRNSYKIIINCIGKE